MFYASEIIHRNRHRHRRRQNNSPLPPEKKYSPSPSPTKKKNITVTVARWRWPRFFHRWWQITVMPCKLVWSRFTAFLRALLALFLSVTSPFLKFSFSKSTRWLVAVLLLCLYRWPQSMNISWTQQQLRPPWVQPRFHAHDGLVAKGRSNCQFDEGRHLHRRAHYRDKSLSA